jgi:hypothetical protein
LAENDINGDWSSSSRGEKLKETLLLDCCHAGDTSSANVRIGMIFPFLNRTSCSLSSTPISLNNEPSPVSQGDNVEDILEERLQETDT